MQQGSDVNGIRHSPGVTSIHTSVPQSNFGSRERQGTGSVASNASQLEELPFTKSMFQRKMATANTGRSLNLKNRGIIEYVKSQTEDSAPRFTGDVGATTLTLTRLFEEMERYHLAPDVTYKDKIKVLRHMCDGKARERLDTNPRDSTYDDYVAMWQLLYDLVGDDGAQASALWSHLTAATPKSSSYTSLAEYALDMQSTADKLTILQAGTDDNIWTSAWRAVLLHATEAFNSFKLQEPELGQCFMREPHHYYETRPREKFMQFRAFLDYQARQERHVSKSAVMNAQINTKKSGKDNKPRNEKKAYPAEAAPAAKNESKTASAPPGNKKRDGPKPCQSCLEAHPTRECPVTDLDERKALFSESPSLL
jgi:hypothetical protein